MEVVNKKVVLVLFLIGIFSCIFIWQNISDKETMLEIVSLNNEEKSSSMFAIMLEQEDGTYKESDDNSWPSSDVYLYDDTRSGCMDVNGNKIENTLTYDSENKIASVKTEKTSYCYLYFKIIPNLYKLCKEYENISECMLNEYNTKLKEVPNITQEEIENTGGMRRYQGNSEKMNNNYICFGTSNIDECLNNTNKYLYRIIGIMEDGKLKIIKKTSLDNMYKWDDYYNRIWATSTLFITINGSGFLENILDEWKEKIFDTSWKYGSISSNGNYNANETYLIENNWADIVNAKIGLMYIHDYYYAYPGGVPENALNASKSWIWLQNNSELNILHPYDWLISINTTYNGAWYIGSDGSVNNWHVNSIYSARPVFYTIPEIKISSGIGTLSNPYIIE